MNQYLDTAYILFKRLERGEDKGVISNEINGNQDMIDAVNFHCDMNDLADLAIV